MATPVEALQLIIKFKYLQSEYYRRGQVVFAAGFTPGELAVVQQIGKQDDAHIAQFATALGASAPARPLPDTLYDYSAGSGTGTGPFALALTGAATKINFFKLAQLFEDFSVRLIKGQLTSLMADTAKLRLALGVHATEGRHAAEVRLMRGGATGTMVTNSTTAFAANISPWITSTTTTIYDVTAAAGYTGAATTPTTQAYVATMVYGAVYTGADRFTHPTDSESNPSQRGYAPANAEMFDEPISTENAVAFLARFGVA